MRGDFIDTLTHLQTNGAESLPLGPHRIGNVRHDALDFIGASRGGGIEIHNAGVHRRSHITHQKVTNRAAHEVQPMPRLAKTRGEGSHFLKNRGKTGWNHADTAWPYK